MPHTAPQCHNAVTCLPSYHTAGHHILTDSNLHSHCCEAQKLHKQPCSPHRHRLKMRHHKNYWVYKLWQSHSVRGFHTCTVFTAQSTALPTSTISKPNTGSLFYLPTIVFSSSFLLLPHYHTLVVSWVDNVTTTNKPTGSGNWMLSNKIMTLYITNA